MRSVRKSRFEEESHPTSGVVICSPQKTSLSPAFSVEPANTMSESEPLNLQNDRFLRVMVTIGVCGIIGVFVLLLYLALQ